MSQLKHLNDRIISRVNVNLAELEFDTDDFVMNTLDHQKMLKFYAFYGITAHHPIYFHFKNSNIAGSYFLGKCVVSRSTIYKSDVRGDELKRKGDNIKCAKDIPLVEDEVINIKDSLLYKTLVHSNSHNPESPEEFGIRNTISTHYANIHGSTLEGCFLGPFSTVDLMNLHSCIVGEFSYVQVGELFHRQIEPGTVWVRSKTFEFKFKYPKGVLDEYIGVNASHQPRGIIYDFVSEKETDYERLFEVVDIEPVKAPESSAVNRYAVIKPKTEIGENVLISQRAYLENARMGNGSNAQENTYIVNSHLEGMNVTAHGGKIINTVVGLKTFVGFNSFLYGKDDAQLTLGKGCIVMPHTIVDIDEPLEIPEGRLIWGHIRSAADLSSNTMALDEIAGIRGSQSVGNMTFTGSGQDFVEAFSSRIEHILEANGAYYDYESKEMSGHAQEDQQIAFNTLQPYRSGENAGIYPSIRIKP
ncbi:MAG TPA: transferase [Desulfobacteraceae bacterium]|nr:transferase [Desulfobacteraceae bacterium]